MTAARLLRRSRGTAGFSLFEVLVALALLSIIASFLSGGITFGRRAWEASAARDEPFAIEAGRSAVKDMLRRALPLRPAPDRPDILFEGRRDAIAFVALADPDVETGGLRVICLRMETANGRSDFVAASLPESAGLDGRAATGRATVLFKNTASVGLRYLLVDPLTGTRAWQDDWRGQPVLPSLVELRVAFRGPRAPLTVVAPLNPGT